MTINPGDLNKRISFIENISTQDSDGYDIATQNVFYSCWAKFSRTSGTEVVKESADFSEVKSRFLIRYTNRKINRKMAIRYDGDEYEIQYINDYGDNHEYIEIMCMKKELR